MSEMHRAIVNGEEFFAPGGEIEDMPEVATTSGWITALSPVAPDVVEVSIALDEPTEHLPGQYFQVKFRGFPARCYSPTVPLDRFGDQLTIHLHVLRVQDGRVSSALGHKIREGHRVKLEGPFGSAYLRPNQGNRLVLVAGGTGFAPIWSIADAAKRENFQREIVLVAGARSIELLYMIPALTRLATCPNVTIVPVTHARQTASPVIQTGLPTDYVPELRPDDIVYAAGTPRLVDAIKEMAAVSGAMCHAVPFVPNSEGLESVLSQATNWFIGETQAPSLSTPAAMPQRSRTDFGDEGPQTRWLRPPPAAAAMPQRSRADYGDERPQTRWLTSRPAAAAMPQRSRTDFGDERPQTRWLTAPPAGPVILPRSRTDFRDEQATGEIAHVPAGGPRNAAALAHRCRIREGAGEMARVPAGRPPNAAALALRCRTREGVGEMGRVAHAVSGRSCAHGHAPRIDAIRRTRQDVKVACLMARWTPISVWRVVPPAS